MKIPIEIAHFAVDVLSMKILRIAVIALHFFVGMLGLLGGYAAVSTPAGPFGISTDILRNGPFSDFFIPGLTLLIVIGIGHISTGIVVWKDARFAPYVQGAMAAVTLGWIVIQCWVMEEVNAMHITIFAIGAAQGLYALSVVMKRKIFPANIILKMLGKA